MTDRLTQGICAIGMPLPLYGGTPCAIAVAGPSFRIKRKEDKIVTIIRQLSGMYLKDASATGLHLLVSLKAPPSVMVALF